MIIEIGEAGEIDFLTGQCSWPSQIVYGDSSIMYVLDPDRTRMTMRALNLSRYTSDNVQKALCTYYCPKLLNHT